MPRVPWRLQVGPVQLVPVVRRGGTRAQGERRWALPGGSSATFAEVVQWARQMGLPHPVTLYEASARFPEKRERTT